MGNNFLEKYPESSSESIENSVNCSEYLIKKMVDEGYITYKEELILMSNNPIKYVNKDYQFTFDQLQTIERFDKSYVKNFLLFSNDEEFKINFYLHIIEENAKQKLPTIFIAPTLFIAEELYMFFKKNYPAHMHIDILPGFQGSGNGTKLVETLLSELKSRGIRGVCLCVGSDNARAIAFYKKRGFKILLKTPGGIYMGQKL